MRRRKRSSSRRGTRKGNEMIQIKSRSTDKVLFEYDKETIKLAVEFAVKSWANLSGADLSWANLSEANLSGAIM